MTKPSKTNTPIQQLIKEYSNESCDFTDIEWVISASLRHVDTMPDSLARCLLYTLALNQFKKLKGLK